MTAEDPRARRSALLLDAWRSLMSAPDLTTLLDRVLARARELTGAQHAALEILRADGIGLAELLAAGGDGQTRKPIDELERGSVLGVPMMVWGQLWGAVYLADKQSGDEFDEQDRRAATILVDWAAVAIGDAGPDEIAELRSKDAEEAVRGLERLRAERSRSSQSAADAERERWARELHGGTLEGLGGMRVLLSAALRRDEQPQAHTAIHDALQRVVTEIEKLGSVVDDLRPAALEDLGLCAAIEALIDRHRNQHGLTIDDQLALLSPEDRGGCLDERLETTAYRIVQDALANVVEHACAEHVRLLLRESRAELLIELQDDGDGFDMTAMPAGFGLIGIGERVERSGGELSVECGTSGTLLTVRLPLRDGGRAR